MIAWVEKNLLFLIIFFLWILFFVLAKIIRNIFLQVVWWFPTKLHCNKRSHFWLQWNRSYGMFILNIYIKHNETYICFEDNKAMSMRGWHLHLEPGSVKIFLDFLYNKTILTLYNDSPLVSFHTYIIEMNFGRHKDLLKCR